MVDFLEELESERRIVPLGFTRPVPWTRPPFARTGFFFGRRVAALSVCFVAVREKMIRLISQGGRSGRTDGRLRGELLRGGGEGSLGEDLP